jgi:HSP20 family molecular chaperone IbpA
MTQLQHWAMDPFDLVWKSFLDANSTFNTMQEKINYPVDIYETENGLRFELAVVGLNQEDLEILVEGDTFRIIHDRKIIDGVEERSYIQRGIARRSFDLAWKVASKFDLNQLAASMDKGLLIIDIPVSEERALKKIAIGTPSPLELKTSKKK